MGGDTGGNDCVHVIDARGPKGAWPNWLKWRYLRPDTDVIIHDEHGNVCQFTYREWTDFVVKIVSGQFQHIDRQGYVSPEDVVPVYGSGAVMDPSAQARIDALPNASVEISGTFDAAEPGEKTVALGTFTLKAEDLTPESRRMLNDAVASGESVTLTLEDGAGILDIPVQIGRPDPSDQPAGRPAPGSDIHDVECPKWCCS